MHHLPDLLEIGCAIGVAWWCLCRAHYMSDATAFIDRAGLVLIGMGAAAHALAPLPDMGVLTFGTLDDFKGALLFPGLAIWLLMPTLRRWRGHLEQRRASDAAL